MEKPMLIVCPRCGRLGCLAAQRKRERGYRTFFRVIHPFNHKTRQYHYVRRLQALAILTADPQPQPKKPRTLRKPFEETSNELRTNFGPMEKDHAKPRTFDEHPTPLLETLTNEKTNVN
jgi:hypothetical protein